MSWTLGPTPPPKNLDCSPKLREHDKRQIKAVNWLFEPHDHLVLQVICDQRSVYDRVLRDTYPARHPARISNFRRTSELWRSRKFELGTRRTVFVIVSTLEGVRPDGFETSSNQFERRLLGTPDQSHQGPAPPSTVFAASPGQIPVKLLAKQPNTDLTASTALRRTALPRRP